MSDPVKNRGSQQEVFPSQTREELRKNPNPKEVADKLDLHISTVYRHAKGMDLELLRGFQSLGISTKSAIIFMNINGMPNSVIAEKVGVSLPYLTQLIRDQIKPEAVEREKRRLANG